jgi:flagellar hook-associated protein 1 FlgK
MSISVGLTGIRAAQYALTTTGSNIANATTEGYARRRVAFEPQIGGMGVRVDSVERLKDMFLEDRLRDFEAKLGQSQVTVSTLSEIEGLLGEPSESGIAACLDDFLNQWQAAAARPEDATERNLVLLSAQRLVNRLNDFSDSVAVIRSDLLNEAHNLTDELNALAAKVVENNALLRSGSSRDGADLSIKDDQDRLARDIAALIGADNVKSTADGLQVGPGGTISTGQGTSTEVLPPRSPEESLFLKAYHEDATMVPSSGRLAGIIELNQTTIPEITRQVDAFTTELIRLVNTYHAEGLGMNGRFTSISSEQATMDIDGDGNRNNDVLAAAGLAFTPTAGDVTINIADSLGAVTAHTLTVDPDSDTLSDVAAALDALTGLSAAASDGRLTMTADAGYAFDFCADQATNVLAALGVNAFFSGQSAADIRLADRVSGSPDAVACARSTSVGDGTNAARISDLRTAALASDATAALPGLWESVTAHVGATSAAAQRAEASAQNLHELITAQEQNTSGVSLDEEASRLMEYNQLYMSCAKYISVVSKLQDFLIQYI